MNETPLQRALAQAPERTPPRALDPDEEFFVFRLGVLTLGVVSTHVREVTRMGPLTPLPRTPSFMLGVVGHRGEVLPLVDLLRFFAQGEAKPSLRTRLFVGESEGFVTAFVTDGIIGLRRVMVAEKLPPPVSAGAQAEFVSGVVATKELGTLSLLDLVKVINAARGKAVTR